MKRTPGDEHTHDDTPPNVACLRHKVGTCRSMSVHVIIFTP